VSNDALFFICENNVCFFVFVLLEIASKKRGSSLLKDVPNLQGMDKDGFEILSILIWQILAVFILSLVCYVFFLSWPSFLFGGSIVVMSTWHVHRSVNQSPDDRGALLQAAGVRFFLFLSVLAVGIYFLQLEPVMVIAGMAAAYVTLYVRSFIIIFKKMKGDGLG